MPRRVSHGGALSTRGNSPLGPVASFDITIDGVDRTTDEFKRIRRSVSMRMREAQVQVGQREVLPALISRLGPVVGKWAQTMYIKRDRLDVFVGSRLRGKENRALGWLDFGGRRPRDRSRRIGPYVILTTLDDKQPRIRAAIEDAVLDQFRDAGFKVG